MRKHGLRSLFLLAAICGGYVATGLLSATTLSAQSKDSIPPWFITTKVAEKIWRIEDHGADNLYLVEGSKKALLIDTGLGAADISKFVHTLTQLPVVVVNTHGHPDHAGGDYQFPEVYANPRDFEVIFRYGSPEGHQLAWQNMLRGVEIPQSRLLNQPSDWKPARLLPVKQGFIFDLGDRKLEVLEVPGHTQGSICLLDCKNKILFTGDTNNPQVWHFLKESTVLSTFLQTLEGEKKRQAEFETMLPGHGTALQKDFIDEQIACVKSILHGNCKGEPFPTWLGDARLCRFKRAAIVFNAEKVK
jgi:hydroxyacylglutathione hydrolase